MKMKIVLAVLLWALAGCGSWSAAAGVAYNPEGSSPQYLRIDQSTEAQPTPTPDPLFN